MPLDHACAYRSRSLNVRPTRPTHREGRDRRAAARVVRPRSAQGDGSRP